MEWTPKWLNIGQAKNISEFARPLVYATYGNVDTGTADRLFDESLSVESIERNIGNGYRYLFIEVDGTEVGFIVLHHGDDMAYLDHFYILPEYCGKGIGSNVMEWVFSTCCTNGYPILETVVLDDNVVAAGFFKKMGFEEYRNIGRRKPRRTVLRRKFRSSDLIHVYYI
ncbi:MAG: GNAT family N-acetyltransferase [archaeon]|nr:GNAT family N-acetyltransferase [archaeon]